jgi:hypothetical protein
MKQCKKLHKKGKRRLCEKQARKKYAAKASKPKPKPRRKVKK